MRIRSAFPQQVREVRNLRIPLSDGTWLAARLWLPEDAEQDPVPAIIEYIPYRQHDGTANLDALTHPYFAGHGYAALRVDIRGSGNSEGVLRDEYLRQEQDDALEILAWLAEQTWCTGAAGMIGISWGGFAALQIAARRPPQLKAIVTVCSTDDRYTDDVHWMGGCLLNDSISWGGGIFGVISRPPDPGVVGEAWRDLWLQRLESNDLPLVSWLKHQRRDEFWRHGSVCEDYGAIDCAVYAVGGWTDGYTNAIFRLMEHLEGPRRALVGPWTHVYPHFGFPGPPIGFLQDCLRWWDRWLKDIHNGIDDEPKIYFWMQENLRADASEPEVGGHWRSLSEWPPASPAQMAAKRLHLGGALLSDAPGPETEHVIRSPLLCGLAGGEWCPRDSGSEGPEFQSDQGEDDGRSLCFDSAPLTEPLEILGQPVLNIPVSADKPRAQLIARLCDVAPDGRSSRVTFGVLNLCHRDGHETPVAVVPGEVMSLELRLKVTAYRFLPGHKLRLALSMSYWPMVWPSPEIAALTLKTAASSLSLPLYEPSLSPSSLAPFEAAESAPGLKTTVLEPGRSERLLARDMADGSVCLDHLEDGGLSRLDDIDLTLRRSARETFRIREGDPLSASTEMRRVFEIGRGRLRLATDERLKVTCDDEAFIVSAVMEAYEGEVLLFSRSWNKRVPRDCM